MVSFPKTIRQKVLFVCFRFIREFMKCQMQMQTLAHNHSHTRTHTHSDLNDICILIPHEIPSSSSRLLVDCCFHFPVRNDMSGLENQQYRGFTPENTKGIKSLINVKIKMSIGFVVFCSQQRSSVFPAALRVIVELGFLCFILSQVQARKNCPQRRLRIHAFGMYRLLKHQQSKPAEDNKPPNCSEARDNKFVPHHHAKHTLSSDVFKHSDSNHHIDLSQQPSQFAGDRTSSPGMALTRVTQIQAQAEPRRRSHVDKVNAQAEG
ncbi:hypothetical protein LXL04_007881 [Taraxacum kok-saghyz]